MKKNLLTGLGIGIVVISAILIFVIVLNGGIPNANVAADNTALQPSERSQVMGGEISYEITLNTSMPSVPENVDDPVAEERKTNRDGNHYAAPKNPAVEIHIRI